jgi:uncharacterized membrane-anchored protein YitT (DUF2179 family)
VLMRGATTGGTDMVARLLSRRVRFLSIGKLMMAIDGLVILASAFVFQSVESAMYACIVNFVSAKVIDTVLYGVDIGTGKLFYIFSPKVDQIADCILREMNRGVTFLKSRGGYSGEEGEVLLCAVRRFEIYRLHEIIRKIDREAFVIVGDAGEITGEGFKAVKSDDKSLKEMMRSFQERKKG